MPFADIRSFVAGLVIRLGDGNRVVVQSHIVQKNAVRERVSTRHQARPIRAAHRTAGHRVTEADAFCSQLVEVRRANVWIARVAGRLRTPLIREDKDKIRFWLEAFGTSPLRGFEPRQGRPQQN